VTGAASSAIDWTSSGPEEVAEGVFRIPLPLPGDGLKAVNAYLLRGSDGDLLIDCGWDHPLSWEVLSSQLDRLSSGVRGVRQIFATHFHGDHLGVAGRIRDASRAFVTLGLGDRESAMILATDPALARQRTRELLWRHGAGAVVEALDAVLASRPRPDRLSPVPDLFLSSGALSFEGRQMEILPTPGHTRGHLCLLDSAAGILFAGDHLLPHITPSIGVEVPDGGLPLLHFLRSLELVRDLPVKLVLPAHGPTFPDLPSRVDQLLEHHRQRLRSCQEAVQAGAGSAIEVARALPWTRRNRKFEDLDPFNQMLAVSETAAHLDLLAERAELGRSVSDLGVLFTPASGGFQPAEAP
jgi:glyoxylase-like metal-dependent hydrolase (beta-lactamase superfamily II)